MVSVLQCDHCRAPIFGKRTNGRYCCHQCRFLAKIEPADLADPDGCWRWRGSHHGKGYGHFRWNKAIHKAHRASYELFCASIPEGLYACHRCDNTECVNPRHIFLGTNEDNLADRQAKGRQARGESHGFAKLTEEDVRFIRRSDKSDFELAALLNVRQKAVFVARIGRTWKHLNNIYPPRKLAPGASYTERRPRRA